MSRKISSELAEHMVALQHLIDKYPKMVARYVYQMYKDGVLTEIEKDIFFSRHGLFPMEEKQNFSLIATSLNKNGKEVDTHKVMSIYNDAFQKIVQDMIKPVEVKVEEIISKQ